MNPLWVQFPCQVLYGGPEESNPAPALLDLAEATARKGPHQNMSA